MTLTTESILNSIKMAMSFDYERAGFAVKPAYIVDQYVFALISRDGYLRIVMEDTTIILYMLRDRDISCDIHDYKAFKKFMARLKMLTARSYGRAYHKIAKDAQRLTLKEKEWLIKLLSKDIANSLTANVVDGQGEMIHPRS